MIQRFGGALNLNIHFHTLALDGVFTEQPDGSLGFVRAPAPKDEEVEDLLETIVTRIVSLLVCRGVLGEDPELTSDDEPPSAR